MPACLPPGLPTFFPAQCPPWKHFQPNKVTNCAFPGMSQAKKSSRLPRSASKKSRVRGNCPKKSADQIRIGRGMLKKIAFPLMILFLELEWTSEP